MADERTLVLCKPDAVARGLVGEVVSRLERKGFRLVAMELQVPDLSNAGTNAPVILTIPALKVTPPMVSRLGEILSHHKGESEVRIRLQGPSKTTVLRLDRHRVKPDPALFGDLKVLLGPSCLAG